ncbi:unnamed protein product [Candidula unifasciata]|uniref:SUN domain-containing protein n=1 Tax=Candidula unifasciata TaxID=100452 RepID=A0A8S3Z1P7_9EUPU|nr:unnamed protein product [Candidula unifasciata]
MCHSLRVLHQLLQNQFPLQTSNTEAAHQMNMTQIYEFIQQINAASAASSKESGQHGLTKEQVEAIVKGLLASSVQEIATVMQGQVEALKILLQGEITSLLQKVTGLEAEIRTVVGAHQMLTDKINQAPGSFEGFTGQNADWLAASHTLEHKLLNLTQEVNHLSSQYASLSSSLVNCCRNSSDLDGIVRAHVFSLLSQMSTDKDGPLASLVVQMGQNYVDKAEMESRLSAITLEVIRNVKVTQAETEQKSDARADVQEPMIASLNESAVKSIVEEALNQFSADRVGMADFALESAGGSVISIRCSETYYKKTALVSVFGIPLWYTSNSPRTVIQPDVHPGECWAFKGQTGFIVLQLSLPIEPSGFTLEHIPRSLTLTGDISSAPKEFAVFGLVSERDTQGISLGNYTYKDNGTPIQFFPVQNTSKNIFQLVELRILSNHGNKDYTCIYRFRVHGTP